MTRACGSAPVLPLAADQGSRCRQPPRRPGGLQALLAAWAAACSLAACGSPDQEDIQDWITRQRQMPHPAPQPLAEIRPFTAQAYPGDGAADPFSSQRLTQALRHDPAQEASAALVRPEQARPRQPLEAYPLDAMAMVGSLVSRGQRVALVRVDRQVHPVRPGAYLGQNFGKVTQVTETQVLLREIVQDPSGQWSERAASLKLQESAR